jgi:membrane protein
LAVLFTLAGMFGMFVLMPLVAVLPKVLDFFHIGAATALLRWPAMALGAWVTLALLYRYSPERNPLPSVRAVLPGAALAAVCWVLLCASYSAYVQYFTSFSSTYGALTGVIVLEFWLYVSSLLVVYGAELNAELERVGTCGEQQELPLPIPPQAPASSSASREGVRSGP